MAIPCAPPIPVLPGNLSPARPAVEPVIPVIPAQIGNIAIAPPPEPERPAPPPPVMNMPRAISELPLTSSWVMAWLATLARATYHNTDTYFARAARVVSSDYTTTYVPNAADSSTPGYGVVHMPQGLIVVVSGTTNPGQWLSQTLRSTIVDWIKPQPFGTTRGVGTMAIWRDAAIAIGQALTPMNKGQGIMYVGHSMGGAIASLMFGNIGQFGVDGAMIRLATFAAPQAGDVRLQAVTPTGSQVARRCYVQGDVVPMLPPDLSALNVVIPAELRPYTDSWALFLHSNTGYDLAEDGTLTPTPDPDVLQLLLAALTQAATGNPLALVRQHQMITYAERLVSAAVLRGVPPTSWANRNDLVDVNVALTNAGL